MITDLLLRITLAGALGGLIGLERQLRAKDAGLRTHILVGIGSAMFMIVSKYGFEDLLTLEHVSFDPSRVAAQVVSGMGFLGAGTIMIQKQMVKGLTTAAGMWVTAAIGLVIGSGLYEIGIYGTMVTLVVLEIFRQLSNRFIGQHHFVSIKLLADSVPRILIAMQKLKLHPINLSVAHKPEKGKHECELTMEVTLPPRKNLDQVYETLLAVEGIHQLDIK
ncbi:TPA: MgtC/SapB family protein [Yersinia enterocolitica]|uniref:MgtC/SapB family protein n=1 Tax=Yersinia enterocolitica TaxID=630 RepID=UPI000327E081|nr:MgtC/SapB family protein [Yersinia enterocolitica]EKN3325986.1 MgtC/SapB family protein [Yersinia enterocolitica]EKN3350399.1 MgtC/SapB family protein [Yersinia enterocolitica]EKN3358410.1 MgtC/SapB family protein [Yersinia enterocolitica]EKN3365885.1 MgtC/SapB family protein [Yersinia enterocolitica]EKN3381366.1 MgtC/SapB family protein [Yersinia enterocolitica]